MHAVQGQRGVCGVQEGADIERCAGCGRDPCGIRFYQLSDCLQAVAFLDARQPQPVAGAVQPRDILPGSEQLHRSVRTAVRLQPFKDLRAVVQDACCRRDADRPEGYDARVMPSRLVCIIHQKHMVCEHRAKPKLADGRQFAGVCCFRYADIHRHSLLSEWFFIVL